MFDDFFTKNNNESKQHETISGLVPIPENEYHEQHEKDANEIVNFEDFKIPKKSNLPLVVIVILTILIIAATAGFIYIKKQNDNDLAGISDQTFEVTIKLDEIDTKLADLERISSNDTMLAENSHDVPVLGDTTVNLRNVRYYNDVKRADPEVVDNVLGVYDDQDVNQLRAEKAVLGDLRRSLSDLRDLANKAGDFIKNSKYLSFFNKDLEAPVNRTIDYVDKKLAQVDYATQVYDLAMQYSSWMYRVRVSVQEALFRGLDEYSVNKLADTVNEIDQLNDKAAQIDTSMLDENTRRKHDEIVADLSSDTGTVALVKQLANAMKDNNADDFEKVIISMQAHTAVESNNAEVAGNTTLEDSKKELGDLKGEWLNFRAELDN